MSSASRIPGCTPLALLAAAVAVLASVVSCGGGGGAAAPTVTPAEPAPGTLQASQPGELLSYVKAKLLARQALRAAAASNNLVFTTTSGAATADAPAAATGEVLAATAIDRSATTVQESGVDEDDVLKSDGTLLVALARDPLLAPNAAAARVLVHRRAADGSPLLAGTLTLDSEGIDATIYRGLYLATAQQRAAALGESQTIYVLDFCPGLVACVAATLLPLPVVTAPTVTLDVIGLSDPAAPSLAQRWRIDGSLVGSRLIGNSLVLVTQFTPNLAVDALPYNAPASERDAVLAKLTAADVLPTLRIDGAASQALVTETDCYVEPSNANLGVQVTTITTIDLSSPTLQRKSRCFIGGSEALYMSPQALYLATTRSMIPLPGADGRLVYPQAISTDIHKFALGGGTVDYRGSGNVAGHLGWDVQSRSYRFSEFNGDLRVLSYTAQIGWVAALDATSSSAPPPSPATLTILRERASDKTLQTVSTLPNAQRPAALGKSGEQVYAVRFVGGRGYVVTFRRIDPLVVLDLSNPVDPKALGELTTAGFSSYLFPVGDASSGLLLGVGHDADDRGVSTGVKVALFDVADGSHPTQLGSVVFGDASSQSGLDVSRHGIDLFARGTLTRVALPVIGYAAGATGWPFALQRVEVDAAARSLQAKAPLAAGTQPFAQAFNLDQQRTLQIGDQLYWWNGSALAMFAW